jgi:hypothetical protein
MIEPFLLKDYLSCMLKIRSLEKDELENCVEHFVEGEERFGRMLEERCLPQVISWVLPYRGLGVSFQGLIELGNRGLVKGIRGFKGGREVDMVDCMERAVVAEVEGAVFAKRPKLVLLER